MVSIVIVGDIIVGAKPRYISNDFIFKLYPVGSQQTVATPADINPQDSAATSHNLSPSPPSCEVPTVTYACSAVHGFFRSIALSVENSLQDTLRFKFIC